jgi:acetyl-CoA carboxylase biotin carboxyl carrier protein
LNSEKGMKPKKPVKASGSSSFAGPDLGQIEQLLRFMSEHNLEEFEYSKGDLRIRLRKPSANVMMTVPRAAEIIVPSALGPMAGGSPSAPESGASSATENRGGDDLHLVKSPIVGTYYSSPSPGTEEFVKVGGHIDSGQTLCIVEAMKLMNEIESDVSGEVLRIFVENGQPVEYGQPLFGIRPSRKR